MAHSKKKSFSNDVLLKEGDNRKITKHHKLPRARGGKTKGNIEWIPERMHRAWHIVFGNLTPEEAIKFIQMVFATKKGRIKKWKAEELYELQIKIQFDEFPFKK